MSDAKGRNGTVGVNYVPDSPAYKRRRDNYGGFQDTSNPNSGYNSDVDSGDDLFDNLTFTTPEKHVTQPTQIVTGHQTQPTQIVDRGQHVPHPLSSSPVVATAELQVPASSPFRPTTLKRPADSPSQSSSVLRQPPSQNQGQNSQGRAPPNHALHNRPQQAMPRKLGSAMAPAGTSFKTPHGVVKSVARREIKPITIDLDDDDGPQYKGGSSDEGGVAGANIKPSSFGSKVKNPSFDESKAQMPIAGAAQNATTAKTAGPAFNFSTMVQSARYDSSRSNGVQPSTHRPVDTSASAYGSRRPPVQHGPARAQPLELAMVIDDIPDQDIRRKIGMIQGAFPNQTVSQCYNALIEKKLHTQDALNLIADRLNEEQEREQQAKSIHTVPPSLPNMKVGAQGVASINSRYIQPIKATSQPSQDLLESKPKKRLVQGRKHKSSPPPTPSPQKPEVVEISDGEDSGLDTQEEESEDNPEFDSKVLSFLNKCSASELADLVSIKIDVAQGFVAARPFKTWSAAESYSDAKVMKSGKVSKKAPIGEKIVQNASDMMQAYDAVDWIVKKCEAHAKPLNTEMAKWGFDVTGKGKGGELEMVSFDDTDSQKDSAIGTPLSKSSGDEEVRVINGRQIKFLTQPKNMNPDIILKDYQLVGLNWLSLIRKQGLSCILADDMGLGKTCQVIAFLSHLVEIGASGPHLVIVPSSVLENWLREFIHFSPDLNVFPYHGSQAERAAIAENILEDRDNVNVVVASYDNSKRPDDSKFLRRLNPDVCVFDEGHALKNPDSQRYKTLMRVPAKMRLILTGTPLQNNLRELAAILAFILPEVFLQKKDELDYIFKHKATTSDSDHAALLSTQRTQRARSMLTPFVLRRKKEQVLKHMPKKTCRVEYCSMTAAQKKIYSEFTSRAAELKRLRDEGVQTDEKGENNPIMQLRKAAIHPMLFRRHFTDDKLKKMLPLLKKHEPESFRQRDDQIMGEMQYHTDFILHGWCATTPCISKFDTPNEEWMNSGKVEALVRLLNQYKANGDRVLVFSQFTMVLDVLEAVLQTSMIQYSRIDGSTRVDERQTLIDQFRDNEDITCFLLSTGAGGQGINLMYANKVIIFDQSFNPQDDVQAENRAHRVGQKRDVEVVRLITKGTIEEPMYALGRSKLALDNKVSGVENPGGEESFKKLMEQKVLDMLVEGKTELDGDDVAEVDSAPTDENKAGTEAGKSAGSSPSQPDVDTLVIDKNDDSEEMLL